MLTAASRPASGAVGKAALFCAGIALPEGGVALVRRAADGKPGETESRTADTNRFFSLTGVVQTKKLSSTDDLVYTPADIAALIKKAQTAFAGQKKDGPIEEMAYGVKNASSVYKNVTVKNATATKSLNIEKVLKEPLKLAIKDKTKPAVLIIHTHTTEGFEMLDRGWYARDYSSRTADSAKNIARVGTEVADQLTKAGYAVIHDKTVYDTTYRGAYERSRASIEKHLKKYPELQVVLDIHRDAIQYTDGRRVKPTAVINGKKAAQIMIATGAEEKTVKNFSNWEHNLRFALKLQQQCETVFPGLMRPVLFCTKKYNLDLTRCSLLLEMGSDVNTLDEAAYSGRMLGFALARLLEEYT